MPGFLADAMSRQKNRWLLPVLKTARSWSLPPLTLLTGEDPNWADDRNRLLATALTVLESETCPHCSTPSWIGHSTDRNITFDVDSTTCFGCAEIERDQENDRRNSRSKPKGEFRYVVPHNVWPDEPLPSRAELYRAELERSKE